jgi:dTMP kinase
MIMDRKGHFITFEGLDGCGKSTQVRHTAQIFRDQGFEVVEIRDPGSTAVGEAAREILLNPRYAEMDATTEILLFAVARSQLVAEVIRPALEEGKVVLSDRFFDSTTAYQGYGRQLNLDMVLQINAIGAHSLVPDLTFIFDISPETSAERMVRSGKSPDRMENEKLAFHQRVREGFLEIARQNPDRCRVLDGYEPEQEIRKKIHRELLKRYYI